MTLEDLKVTVGKVRCKYCGYSRIIEKKSMIVKKIKAI